MRTMLVLALALALAGCGTRTKSGDSAATATPATETQGPAAGADAAVAGQPNLIAELNNQTVVYECPQCGMMFDGPGKCSMEQADLVETQVSYICPADSKPVESAGKCPRCPKNASVVKTAMGAAPTPTGN